MWLLIVIVVALLFFHHRKKKNDNSSFDMPTTQTMPKRSEAQNNSFGQRMDRLTPEGDLPSGWVYQNKEFVDKATAEYIYFSKQYTDHEYGDPKEKYAGLKSLLLYIEDAKKLYAKKGECFLFWFVETWAKEQEVKELYSELRYIEEHYDELKKEYDRKQYIERILIPELKKKAIEVVKENPGIIQTDAYGFFDPNVKPYVQEVFRALSKEGKIKREKHGRTYKLSI